MEKRKINDFVYEKKINEVLERNNPYRDLYVPIQQYRNTFKIPSGFNEDFQESSSNNNPYLQNNNNKAIKDLASSSTMIYNKDELINEKYEYNEKISKLANVGKSLMGDTQFVPINEPKKNKYTDHNLIMLNDTYHSFKNKDEYGNNTGNFFNNTGMNDLHMGTQYSSRKAKNPANFGDVMTTFDLNNQIDELAKITYKNDPKAKIEALNKKIQFDLGNIEKDNHTIEYHDPKKFSKKVDFTKLDNILNSIIDEENKLKDTKNKSKGKDEDMIVIKQNLKQKELNKDVKNNESASGKEEDGIKNLEIKIKKEEEKEKEKEINPNSINQKEEHNNLLESSKGETKISENNQGKNEKSKDKTNVSKKDEKKNIEGSQKDLPQKDESKNDEKIKENQKEEEKNKENTLNKAKTESQKKSKDPVNENKANQQSKEDKSSSNESKNLNNNSKQETSNKEDKSVTGQNNNTSKKQEESVKENKEKKNEKTEEEKSTKDKKNGVEKKK